MRPSSRLVQRVLKRGFDVVTASLLVLILSPLLLIAALAVALDTGRPILFRQTRVGRDGKPFDLIKFRSMAANSIAPEQMGQVRENHQLVTTIGRFLRRYKVDEVPQLWNVIRGDMSLVGPRPILTSMAANMSAFQSSRLNVRPGMTGWAQVNGNIEMNWDERMLLDVWYVQHWSVALDLEILLRTIKVIVYGERRSERALEQAKHYAERVDRSGGVVEGGVAVPPGRGTAAAPDRYTARDESDQTLGL